MTLTLAYEETEADMEAELPAFDGQERCEHDVPLGLHAQPGRSGHSCSYTNARTALVPLACARVKNADPLLEEGTRPWWVAFGAAMDALVLERLPRAQGIDLFRGRSP